VGQRLWNISGRDVPDWLLDARTGLHPVLALVSGPSPTRRWDLGLGLGRTGKCGYIWSVHQVPEDRLQAGEEGPTNRHHRGIEITEESLRVTQPLVLDHGPANTFRLSFGALRGSMTGSMAHAVDD
jgi:hypothetical protein